MTRLNKPIRSVAIIGGGASGAITLDSLVQEGTFDEIVLFERRDVLGGVWALDSKPDQLDIPPGLDETILDPPLKSPLVDSEELKAPRSRQQRYVHTASYENLRTNIPEQLMTYSDLKTWGDDPKDNLRVEDVYIRRNAIQNYIERYFERHSSHIVYKTTVEDISKDYESENPQFVLTLRSETDEKDKETGELLDRWYKRKFDAVIVATGHYHVPFIPDVPGLQEVYQRFPSKVRHSKTFRASDDFKDKKVVIIGTRASGSDIVQIASESAKEIYQSRRSQVGVRTVDASNVFLKPLIESYELRNNTDILVHFSDGSIVENPDEIIYATGFRFSYPFLRKQYPNFTTGYVIPDLYQHTFFNKDPLLSVIGVPTDAISFRAFEFQAILVSRYLSGKIELPPLEEQIKWSLIRYQNKGNNRSYHTIDVGNKVEYLESLTELGGGVEPIGGSGRKFPVFSEADNALFAAIVEKLSKFFSETEIQDGDHANGVTIPK